MITDARRFSRRLNSSIGTRPVTDLTRWICILVAAAKAVFPVTSRWDRRARRALWPYDFRGATTAPPPPPEWPPRGSELAGVAGWSGRAATSARTRPCTREPKGPDAFAALPYPNWPSHVRLGEAPPSKVPGTTGWCHSSTDQESEQIWARGGRSAALFSAEVFQHCFF
jgi:hypothetical protein